MKKITNHIKNYYTTEQGGLPPFISDVLDVCDDVLMFDRMMEEINISQYLKEKA